MRFLQPPRLFLRSITLMTVLAFASSTSGPASTERGDRQSQRPTEPTGDLVAPHWGATSELTNGELMLVAGPRFITAGNCVYQQVAEDVHISGPDASVHGFWKSYSAGCPAKAKVKTALQAVYCDQFGCRWKTVTENAKNIFADGGKGKRVTARNACASAKKIGWRGRVDVDLIGQKDPAGYEYSTPLDLYCYPSR